MKIISKSRYVLMVVDALIFAWATFFTASRHQISEKFVILIMLLFVFCGIYILFMKGFYKLQKYKMNLKDVYLLLEGIVLAAVIPFLALFFFDFNRVSYIFFFEDIALSFVLILIWRGFFYYQRKYFKTYTNILIIGAGETGKTIAKEILQRPILKVDIAGFIDNDENAEKFDYEGIKLIGKTSNLKELIEKYNIKSVIIAISAQLDYQTRMDISECIPQGVEIWRMSSFYEKITQKIPVLVITPEWFMYDFTSVDRPLYEFVKRVFDIVSSIIILILTLPVLVLIGLAVKLHDGGPVMYFQNRMGKNNKPFKLYKLRTMKIDADKEGMIDKKNTEDDRVIPFCKWIRKARFDEIPQMINILKGEMSIVGPRAEFEEFVRTYEKEIPFYNRRHWVTPGWTGWAQINQGHCVNVDAIIEKLRYDFYYIKHRNIFWDFSILIKAVSLALTGRHG